MKDGTAPGRILIVDDDADVRATLEEHLVFLGHVTECAESSERALALIHQSQPDLIIADVHMGGMSGVELVKRLKGDPRFVLTPVLLLTGNADLASRVAGLAAGADDFFAKPWEIVELEARISSLLRIGRLQAELQTRNRLLRTLFSRFVSEDLATEIVRDPEKHLSVGGEARDVTVLFADLRGFTSLADSLPASDVVEILNAYLAEAVDAVFEFGGTLDKFLGDGVMAVFGVPSESPDDALRAVRCALRLQERVPSVRCARLPDVRLQLGVGINTGRVVAGTIGSLRRMDYTVIGGEVNLAQRLESIAGPGQILITASTYARVEDGVKVRQLGPLRVRGKAEPVVAYDVLSAAPSG